MDSIPDPAGLVAAEPPRLRRKGVSWFLLLAFGGSWAPWAVVHATGGSLEDPVTQLVTAAFTPAIAAIVVRGLITRQGFAAAGLRLNLRRRWRHYLLAVSLPWCVLALAMLAAVVAGLWTPDVRGVSTETWLHVALGPLVCVVAAPIFWGEEFGWTAYLRDRLVPGRPVLTTLLTGTIWGVWHFPLPWVGYLGERMSAWEAFGNMLLWLPLSILLEFVIGWLWSETGSVWASSMLHAGVNLVVALGMAGFMGDEVGAFAQTVLMCVALLPVVGCVVATGRTAGRSRVVADSPVSCRAPGRR